MTWTDHAGVALTSIASVAGDCGGSLHDVVDLAATQRSRIAQLQFVGGERGDRSLLLASDLVRERAGLDTKGESLARFIDRVCAIVGDARAQSVCRRRPQKQT
jgi:hypothetical protein